MVSAIILLNVEYGELNTIAEQLASEEGVAEVYSVAGKYDLFAHVRAASNDALARLVTERVARMKGIRSCETMIAFRVYSPRQLDAAFALGEDS